MTPTKPSSAKMLDTSYQDRYVATRLEDPGFRAEYERQRRVIGTVDAILNRLDVLRVQRGCTKADVARAIDKNAASVRRLLTARGNPELATVVAIADALDSDVVIVPRNPARPRA
jgi:DNA-binding phage protein